MDTSRLSSEVVEVLSIITENNFRQEDITPSTVFMAALVSVLLGVIYVDTKIDTKVTDEEKQRLQTTLNRLAPPGSEGHQLAQQMLAGVQEQQISKKINELQKLTAPLSESEKLLLISLGYQMSAADGTMDAREKNYLQAIANRIGVDSRYLTVLEAGFSAEVSPDTDALDQVHSLLDPAGFQSLDSLFANAASQILVNLPSKNSPQTHLTVENASLELKHSASNLKHLVQACVDELDRAEETWNRKLKITAANRQNVWAQLGECSGRLIKISGLAEQFKAQAVEQANTSWTQALENLQRQLKEKASDNVKLDAQDVLVLVSSKLEEWINAILKQNLEVVEDSLSSIRSNLSLLSEQTSDTFALQILSEINAINSAGSYLQPLPDKSGESKPAFDVLEAVGYLTLFDVLEEVVGDLTGSVAGAVSGIAGMFGFKANPNAQSAIKQKVVEKGWEKLAQSKDKLIEKIKGIIALAIDDRVNSAMQIAEKAIPLYEDFLQRQERYQQETPAQREAEKAWIAQQRQHLDRVQKGIEAILN